MGQRCLEYPAKESNFPFMRVFTSERLVALNETNKCISISQFFSDAYESNYICIILDRLEKLLRYVPLGPINPTQVSSEVLQTLNVFLEKQPVRGRKLLLIWTSSEKALLKELGMLPLFSSILPVPNLEQVDEIIQVLEESKIFSREDINQIKEQIGNRRLCIGSKRLLTLIDYCRDAEPKDRT
jgi:vesicle-fusing ATPase